MRLLITIVLCCVLVSAACADWYPRSAAQGTFQTDAPGVTATQCHLVRWAAGSPVAASASYCLSAASGTARTIATGITSPDVARCLLVDSNSGGASGTVTVTGTAIDGSTISEAFTLSGTTDQTGTKAFSTIVSVAVPAEAGTVTVGVTDKIGLPYESVYLVATKAWLGTVVETTAPAVTTDADEIEKCVIDLHSALNGSAVSVLLTW